jgi:hypothetical protein
VTAITPYWLYSRIDVHVWTEDEKVAETLREYADAHVKGGRAAITDDIINAVLREHHDAQELCRIFRF